MYCIVRRDLKSNSHKACQGGHAIAQYFIDHGMHAIWDNGTMIYLRAMDEDHLLKIKDELDKDGINNSIFQEADYGDQYTAIACIDKGDRFRNFALL